MASGSPDGIGSEPDSTLLSMLGAFPFLVDSTGRFRNNHAADAPESALSRSTTIIVDSAGWTEMVIQEGPRVLSYVSIGRGAEVNASINFVEEAAPTGGGQLAKLGGTPSDNRTCGCPGRSDMFDNRISCLSFNEVTK